MWVLSDPTAGSKGPFTKCWLKKNYGKPGSQWVHTTGRIAMCTNPTPDGKCPPNQTPPPPPTPHFICKDKQCVPGSGHVSYTDSQCFGQCGDPPSVLLATSRAAAECPCTSASLCEPLQLGKRLEIVAFSDHRAAAIHGDSCDTYPSSNCTLNLTAITTLVDWNGFLPAQLYCDAHDRGIRIVRTTTNSWMPFLDTKPNRSEIAMWAKAEVNDLLSGVIPDRAGMRFDGINLDWEHPVAWNATGRPSMALAVHELRAAMDARTPKGSLQLSFDAPWAPYGLPQANATPGAPACVDGRCFDFAAIAKSFGENDFYFIMDYAMQSQIYHRPGSKSTGNMQQGLF